MDFGGTFQFPIDFDYITDTITGNEKEKTSATSYTWTPLPVTKIGSVGEGTETSFPLPEGIVPSSAKEILVFVVVEAGPVGEVPERGCVLRVFTEEGGRKKGDTDKEKQLPYTKYIYVRSQKMTTFSTSHNLWLPLTTDRRVAVEMQQGRPTVLNCDLYLIGYR